MNWFWVICGLLSAVLVWNIENIFWLRLAACMLCIDVAVEAARNMLARRAGDES